MQANLLMSQLHGVAYQTSVSVRLVKMNPVGVIWITVFIVIGALVYDWTRPPQQQMSVALYERTVMAGYHVMIKPFSDKFVHCRFQPSCSHYSEEAMRTHGFPKGLWLTTSRLFRCMPSVEAGTSDPVPRS